MTCLELDSKTGIADGASPSPLGEGAVSPSGPATSLEKRISEDVLSMASWEDANWPTRVEWY